VGVTRAPQDLTRSTGKGPFVTYVILLIVAAILIGALLMVRRGRA
jgi:hypothetical protein